MFLDKSIACLRISVTTVALVAIASLVGVTSGCGGGSESFSTPATVVTTGTGGVSANTISSSGSAAQVKVTWPVPTTLPSGATIVEYHIYRDGSITGAETVGTTSFTDDTTTGLFFYQQYGASDAHNLDMVKGTHTALTSGATHQYRVTVLYGSSDLTASVQPSTLYSEAAIGVSNTVTP